MADFENNVIHLSNIRINERNRKITFEVAADLIHSLLRESWIDLPERQKRSLVSHSANRLWDNYMNKRKASNSTKEAARKAMLEELSHLEQQFEL